MSSVIKFGDTCPQHLSKGKPKHHFGMFRGLNPRDGCPCCDGRCVVCFEKALAELKVIAKEGRDNEILTEKILDELQSGVAVPRQDAKPKPHKNKNRLDTRRRDSMSNYSWNYDEVSWQQHELTTSSTDEQDCTQPVGLVSTVEDATSASMETPAASSKPGIMPVELDDEDGDSLMHEAPEATSNACLLYTSPSPRDRG